MTRIPAWLADRGSPSWAALVLRLLLAGTFLQAGLGKFVNHDAYADRFERWGFGVAPGAAATLTGIGEVTGGLALLLGVVPRLAAIGLIGVMLGALATAGRVDGGRDVWLPIVLIVLLGALAAAGSCRAALVAAVPRSLLPGRPRLE